MTTSNPTSSTDHLDRFTDERYLIRRKVFTLFGGAFHVYDDAGEVVLYSRLKAFKLREDIRLYTGEDMQTQVLSIQARQVIDFSAGYDVIDTVMGQKVGALRRRGMKSLIRDEWLILDENEQPVGTIREDSTLRALARRFIDAVALLMPQAYHAEVGGQVVCRINQKFNPLILKLMVDFTPDTEAKLDRRLGLAAAILLAAIEGRQQ